jgi:FMN phosphatase YigB (HAD superfamily)
VSAAQKSSRRTHITTAVVFDVGETLIDETRSWQKVADEAGVPPFTLMGVLGALIARGEPHQRVWELLGIEPIPGDFLLADFYPDALPCLQRLRESGFLTGAVGNTAVAAEEPLRPYATFVGSSARWNVEKPSGAFYERVIAECRRPASEIAYVGDRVDNDVAPALAAGLVAVHIRRGPWGYLHEPPVGAIAIKSLTELPAALP